MYWLGFVRVVVSGLMCHVLSGVGQHDVNGNIIPYRWYFRYLESLSFCIDSCKLVLV